MITDGTSTGEATELRALRDEGVRLRAQQATLETQLDMQREEFSRELSRKAFRIAELERGPKETAEIFETSLSWRVTKPLRGLKALLTRRGGT